MPIALPKNPAATVAHDSIKSPLLLSQDMPIVSPFVFTGAVGALSGDTDTAFDLSYGNFQATNTGPTLGNNWTFECWIYTRDQTTQPQSLVFGARYTGGGKSYGIWVQTTVGSTPKLSAICQGSQVTGTPLVEGWHHAVASWDAAVGVKLYVDGVLIGTNKGTYDGVPISLKLALGGDPATSNRISAKVDEAAYYPLTMTPAMIQNHYWQGSGNVPAIGAESIHYSPDSSNLIDRVWVVGGTFQGASQTYTLRPVPDGTAYAFPLPDRLQNARTVTVTVNGTDQGTVGVLGVDGKLDAPSGFTKNVIIGSTPPVIAFKTPPANGAAVVVNGTFIYPLIQIVNDTAKQALVGGLIFEKVIRDRRIDNTALANQVGLAHLSQEGTAKAMGGCFVKQRGLGSSLLQPGQSISITNSSLFAGGVLTTGGTTLLAIINRLTTKLVDNFDQPYELEIEFSDRPDLQDDDLWDHVVGEQSRVNAALEQSDVNQVVEDVQALSDTAGLVGESIVTTGHAPSTYTYDSGAAYGFATYA